MAEYVKEREEQKNTFWKVSEDAAMVAKDTKMSALFIDAGKHLEGFVTAYAEFTQLYAEDMKAKYEKQLEDAKAKYGMKGEPQPKERDKTAEAVFNAIFGHLDDEEEDDEEDEDFECLSEPKKPTEIMNVPASFSYDTKAHGVCPSCGGIVDSTQNFCPSCSQALKWEDDDDEE